MRLCDSVGNVDSISAADPRYTGRQIPVRIRLGNSMTPALCPGFPGRRKSVGDLQEPALVPLACSNGTYGRPFGITRTHTPRLASVRCLGHHTEVGTKASVCSSCCLGPHAPVRTPRFNALPCADRTARGGTGNDYTAAIVTVCDLPSRGRFDDCWHCSAVLAWCVSLTGCRCALADQSRMIVTHEALGSSLVPVCALGCGPIGGR
jgi:hypothetical protein